MAKLFCRKAGKFLGNCLQKYDWVLFDIFLFFRIKSRSNWILPWPCIYIFIYFVNNWIPWCYRTGATNRKGHDEPALYIVIARRAVLNEPSLCIRASAYLCMLNSTTVDLFFIISICTYWYWLLLVGKITEVT